MEVTTLPVIIAPKVPPPALPPLDPRTRALVVGLRAVLLMAADVLGEYAGLDKRQTSGRLGIDQTPKTA